MHHECPGRRKKEAERIYKEIMAKNFTSLIIDMSLNINIQESQQTPSMMNLETHTKTHYNQIFKRQQQKSNLESGKNEMNRHILVQGPSTNYKIIYKFIIRNFGSQNTMDQYTEC